MNIPIVGQTFEIDGYKSIECTSDANADAKAFAKANGIPVSEAKYILETLYGSARQTKSATDKATEGVTDTTADEDGEIDGANDEIMAAIDNLTEALEGNDNADKGILAQITTLLKQLIGGDKAANVKTTTATNTTTNTQKPTNTTTTNVDPYWQQLEVEGKGVNLNNIINIVQDAVAEYDAANGISNRNYNARNYTDIYNSFSDEEKAVFDKFMRGKVSESRLKNTFKLFLNGGKTRSTDTDVSKLAFAMADSNGDGFLTDEEIKGISKATSNWDNLGEKLGNKACSTTINGEKVYFVSYPESFYWGGFLAITEKEFEIMDQYLNDENKDNYVGRKKTGEDVKEIWEAIGAELIKENISETKYGFEVLTNSAGIKSKVFDNGRKCSVCDERLYKAYKKIKEAIAADQAA